MEYDMRGFMQQCVDKYIELAGLQGTKLKKVSTPFCTAAQLDPLYDIPGEGVLAPIAARVLMKVMFAARLCRPDLSHTVTQLARHVMKWDVVCDAQLHCVTSTAR